MRQYDRVSTTDFEQESCKYSWWLYKEKKSKGIIQLKNTIMSISKSSIHYEQKFSDSCAFVLGQLSQETNDGIFDSGSFFSGFQTKNSQKSWMKVTNVEIKTYQKNTY